MRTYRWGVLATGLMGGTFLNAFVLGQIPGLVNRRGQVGVVVIELSAAFLYVAGIGAWLALSRIARTLDSQRE